MNLNKALYYNTAIFFLLFFGTVLWAFWPSYFSILDRAMPRYIHFHGIVMTLWCLLIISQAFLVRFKNYRLHRIMGKVSYGLVPLIVISGAIAAHATLEGVQVQVRGAFFYSTVALMFNSLIIFAVLYGLAMYFRKKPVIHARYMVCTLFPIITPITDRLIYNYFRPVLQYIPKMEGAPMVWTAGFLLADIILVVLAVWDWRRHKRINVFPVALGLLILYHISVIYFHNFQFWKSYGDWLMALPLS